MYRVTTIDFTTKLSKVRDYYAKPDALTVFLIEINNPENEIVFASKVDSDQKEEDLAYYTSNLRGRTLRLSDSGLFESAKIDLIPGGIKK